MTPLSITEAQLFASLGTTLGQFGMVAADGVTAVPIIRGQVNRVPQPKTPDYVVMWPLMRNRLATNIDVVLDIQFTGSITANVLTISALGSGAPWIGANLFGAGIAAGCVVTGQLTGTPLGTGTYSVSATPNVTSMTIYAGSDSITQKTEVTVQADVHGPASADNVARLAALWRDPFGVLAAVTNGGVLMPLYHSDPRQLPFDNAENQVEERWTIDLVMQVDPTVTVPMQFAGTLAVTPIPPYTVSP